MREVGVRELKEQLSSVLRRVRSRRESVMVTNRGRAIALITPVTDPEEQRRTAEAVLAEIDQLAKEISAKWPKGVSAVEAVREQRREL